MSIRRVDGQIVWSRTGIQKLQLVLWSVSSTLFGLLVAAGESLEDLVFFGAMGTVMILCGVLSWRQRIVISNDAVEIRSWFRARRLVWTAVAGATVVWGNPVTTFARQVVVTTGDGESVRADIGDWRWGGAANDPMWVANEINQRARSATPLSTP